MSCEVFVSALLTTSNLKFDAMKAIPSTRQNARTADELKAQLMIRVDVAALDQSSACKRRLFRHVTQSTSHHTVTLTRSSFLQRQKTRILPRSSWILLYLPIAHRGHINVVSILLDRERRCSQIKMQHGPSFPRIVFQYFGVGLQPVV